MGKRRSVIKSLIKWIASDDSKREYTVVYIDRGSGGAALKELKASDITYVDRWAFHTKDGDTIPFHRVVEIKDSSGNVVWSRRGGYGGGY